ncbi:MAG TPA: GNAT family N-acetyltransferase [Actinomycetota bacterium]
MSVEVRGIRPEEFDDLLRAVATGFGGHINDRDVALERRVMELERTVAAAEGEVFVGGATASSMTLSVPGAIVPAAGITGVSVIPTHRRRGILTRMMRRILDDVREREPLSVLWAAEGGIYGRFGYGMATRLMSLKVERHHSAFRSEYTPQGSMRLVSREEALKLIPPIYDRVADGQPGFIGQSEAWTDHRFTIYDFLDDGFGKEFFFAIHEGSGGADGYVVYRIKADWAGDEARTLKVEELVAAAPGAYADVWRYVLDVDLVETSIASGRPIHEPLLHVFADPNAAKVDLHDGLWVRLVRVGEALAARRYTTEGRLVLEVDDSFCPWNRGRYELVGGPEGAECRPTDADPELGVSAELLGAAYLGGVSFRGLARAGLVQASPGVLARADGMFGWDPPPWCPIVF